MREYATGAAETNPAAVLVEAVQALSQARDRETVQRIVRTAARRLTGADGATFVLRDGEQCFYVDEDAIAPLWKGKRFPLESCISGWSMLHRQAAVIPDIYVDPRIPHEAYRPTFVKSLVMVPIREAEPIGSIGNYWAREHLATVSDISLLQALANSTAVALENIALYEELEQRVVDRTAELADANRRLEGLATADELTGLLNRRGFFPLAEHDLAVLRRAGRRAAIVFLDVDDLKPLNDGFGHDAGDELLCMVAGGLASACRRGDTIARLGGDEFVALLLDVNESVSTVAHRLRRAVRRSGVDARGDPPAVSIGVVITEPGDGRTIDELVSAADLAMYEEKQARQRTA